MKNRLTIAVILLGSSLLLTCSNATAQDVRFTQKYQNPLLLNPAMMGASSDMVLGLCYRNQWGSINSGYSSYSFNGMYPIYYGKDDNKGKLDAGLSVMEDKAGAFSWLSALVAVDYNRQITDDQSLCLALEGGFGQQSLSTSGLTYDDQYVAGSYNANNPSNETTVSKSKGYGDVGFGFTWVYNPSKDKSKFNAYLGISGFHMNQPNISMSSSVSPLPVRMSYVGGIKIFESDKIIITPNAIVSTQAGNLETAFGAYVDYVFSDDFRMTLGLWYRRKDAIPIVLGFEFKGFSLGYSYDAVISTVNSLSSGVMANEITLTYRLNRSKGGKSSTSAQFSGTAPAGGSGSSSSSSSGTGTNGTNVANSPYPHY
jgi:type IX secretion system PorP/SprF family membrane protein